MKKENSILYVVTDPSGKEIIEAKKLNNIKNESCASIPSDDDVEYIPEIIDGEIKGYTYRENNE